MSNEKWKPSHANMTEPVLDALDEAEGAIIANCESAFTTPHGFMKGFLYGVSFGKWYANRKKKSEAKGKINKFGICTEPYARGIKSEAKDE